LPTKGILFILTKSLFEDLSIKKIASKKNGTAGIKGIKSPINARNTKNHANNLYIHFISLYIL